MQIAYITHDEVNTALANRLAGRLGLKLTVHTLINADQAVAADHLLLDLDHLPEECKSSLIDQAASGKVRGGIMIHSYNLKPGEKKILRAVGARVARRLTARILTPQPSAATS